MKSTTLLLFLFTINLVNAQIVNIPDPNFKNALLNTLCVDINGNGVFDGDADINNDGEIQESEAESVLRLKIIDQNIASLEGIQSFTNIERLSCQYNLLTSLDVSQNTNLEILSCDHNQITDLDLSQNPDITSLFVHDNQLITINLSNLAELWYISIFDNNLTELDVSDCLALEWVLAHNNNLEYFNLSQNPNAFYVQIEYNNLTSLNLKNGHTSGLDLISAQQNPNLGCIMVDDVDYPPTQTCSNDFWCVGPVYNPISFYSEDCILTINEFNPVDFTLYPNPTKDILHIISQKNITSIKIYTVYGSLIKEYSNTDNINVAELPSGLYFASISMDDKRITKRFLKN